MTARLNPYFNFHGEAREAMEFYRSVFGGELSVMTYGDMGGMGVPDDEHHLVMHSDLRVSEGVTIMAADQATGAPEGHVNGWTSLSGDDEALLRGWWDGLAEGGEVNLPLEKAPWGDSFGQLTDKYGLAWMFNIAGTPAAGPADA